MQRILCLGGFFFCRVQQMQFTGKFAILYCMKRIYAVLIFGLSLQFGFGQDRIATYYDKKTPLWTVRIYEGDPLNVREYTLPNGLRIITSVNKSQPRINTMIAVKTGSKNDPASNTGLAHYLEHMLFKGTDKYGTLDWSKEKPLLEQIDALYETYNHTTDTSARRKIYHQIDSVSQLAAKWAIANEFDKMCQSMGATGTNAFTSNEQTVYINDIPSNMLQKWIALEAERYRNPVLRLFHTELEAVYEEKNISLDDDGDKVSEKLYAELFKNHNYGLQTTIGTVEHLKNPSLKAIREYYNTYYVPNNMAIIMSGDFIPDSAVAMIARQFSWMQKREIPTYNYKWEMPHAAPQKFTVTGPDAAYITLGFRMPGVNTREARTAKLIDLLLNNANAGLMDLNLVKKQMVLGASSGVNIMNDYSVFTLTGRPLEGQSLDSVKTLMLSQVKLIQQGKFDDSLLLAILLNEDIGRIAGFKDNANRTGFLMQSFINGSGYQKAYNELWEMRKIRKQEIMELASEYLGNDRVEIYKLVGEDTTVLKIEKPEIHPVELNRDKRSDFVSQWLAQPFAPIAPVFAEFDKKIKTENVGEICPLYYVKNSDNRLFNLEYRYEYGRFHNKALPMALDYLKYLGTSSVSAEEFSKKMYALGCNFKAVSGDKRCYVVLTGPEENFNEAVALFEDLLANAQADETAFTNLIGSIEKKRKDTKLSNDAIERQLSQYALYGSDNPARWVLSNAELKTLKASALIDIIHGLYSKKHQIQYFGQREMADVKTYLIGKHKLPKSFDAAVTLKVFTPRENKENEVYFTNYKQVQSAIYWWNRSNIYNTKEDPIIDVFNQYFGGDMSSVVFQNIREAKALAYSTYAYYITPSMAGEYNRNIAYIGCQADKFKDAFGAMQDLLNKLEVDEQILLLAKESLKNHVETERVDDEGLMDYYFGLMDKGYTSDSRQILYNALPGISIKDVEDFHKSHIARQKYAIAVMADGEKVKIKDLEKYGKVTVISIDELFGF